MITILRQEKNNDLIPLYNPHVKWSKTRIFPSIRADLSYTFTIKLPIFGEKLPILTGTRQRSRKHLDWTLVSIENLDETKH